MFGRKLSFNVTAKGSSTARTGCGRFRYSLMWAVVPVVIMTMAFMRHRPYPMMMAWTAIILFACLAPIVIWLYDRSHSRSRVPGIRVAGVPHPFIRKIQPRWISPPKRPRRIFTDD